METQLDAKLVYQQLDTLLAELHRLRELVKPYVIEKLKRVETEHPHIERVPGVREVVNQSSAARGYRCGSS